MPSRPGSEWQRACSDIVRAAFRAAGADPRSELMSNARRAFLVLIALAVGGHGIAGDAKRRAARAETTGSIRAVLWREPADIASRNLFYGTGGRQHQPQPPFTFDKEDLKQHNPKFVVHDRNGVKWTVKLGVEARPETAASRLLWAAGYFAPEDYFLSELRALDMPPHLHRGNQLVSSDGSVHDVRLKRSMDGFEKIGYWRWRYGPFTGTRAWNGLRVIMALINNWDLKDDNNAIFQEKDGATGDAVTQIYMVSDLGASFGTTGLSLSDARSKGDLDAYRGSKFISGTRGDYVDFGTPSRPNLIPLLFNPPYSFQALRLRWIGRHIPASDARWIGRVLMRLKAGQIRDAFRAAGYAPPQVDAFAAIVERRISALNEL